MRNIGIVKRNVVSANKFIASGELPKLPARASNIDVSPDMPVPWWEHVLARGLPAAVNASLWLMLVSVTWPTAPATCLLVISGVVFTCTWLVLTFFAKV